MPSAPKIVPLPQKKYKPKPRGTTKQRGYGTEHQRQRERRLRENPLCQRCGTAWATDLHHVDGNAHNKRDDNTECLCEACHHADGTHG
jgi:5-methylcytosine-specific restriction endonuclease McrA